MIIDEMLSYCSSKRPKQQHQKRYKGDLKSGAEVKITTPVEKTMLMPKDPNDTIVMLATGTGIAPFRLFFWKMFFDKYDDYKILCSSMVWHGSSSMSPQVARCCTSREAIIKTNEEVTESMLPLPHLKDGYLTAPPVGNTIAPHSDWKRTEFFLNHEALQQVIRIEQKQVSRSLSGRTADVSNIDKRAIRVDIPDIVSVSACADLTLPLGAGLCFDTTRGPVFLVADLWESLDRWIDAIRLVYTIYA